MQLSLSTLSILSTLCDMAHEKTDGTVGRVPECHFLPGPLLQCHIAGTASVLIRGPMDDTLHLHTVTQPKALILLKLMLGTEGRESLIFPDFVFFHLAPGKKEQHRRSLGSGKRFKAKK